MYKGPRPPKAPNVPGGASMVDKMCSDGFKQLASDANMFRDDLDAGFPCTGTVNRYLACPALSQHGTPTQSVFKEIQDPAD